MYTHHSFAEIANQLQDKVREMTQEMIDKNDELESYKDEIVNAQGQFEEIEQELDELIQQINDMNDYRDRIDEAVSEADRLMAQ